MEPGSSTTHLIRSVNLSSGAHALTPSIPTPPILR